MRYHLVPAMVLALSAPGYAIAQSQPTPATPPSTPELSSAALVNGAWNVQGAPKDSQTVPAKFSQRNDAIDKTPILAMPMGLSEDQKRKILDTVRKSNAPIEKTDAKVSSPLPNTVQMFELPASLRGEVQNVKDLKFVRLEHRILIVYAPNWLVVGEIKN